MTIENRSRLKLVNIVDPTCIVYIVDLRFAYPAGQEASLRGPGERIRPDDF